ncbi:acyl-CoA dehydrogenase family protein [Aeromicrobium sp. YIM 150415]|uniref:acyl-CoA dehydrogenase family protein n=1 Tax=Aeromicrobium sp. YIM 150415 TaxID=2803912 RepID=UPI0019629A3F|nr:acyl-CoA dehydrogenase family protein [Aeromicrobium sp. YIM 150415]MBM9463460.1 acyl-CoA dehydrogenase family protein [Aeromicrobium sp. YIM 150415]
MYLTADHLELQARAREVAATFYDRATEIDETEEYPFQNAKDLAAAGFMGLTIPTEYGGPGGSLLDVVVVIEEIAKACGVSGRIVVDGNLGALSIIMQAGPDWMKKRVAELVLAGDKPVIQISEPGSGTDVNGMGTTATVQGDRVVLNGTKTWITGARDSTVNVVVAKLIENGEERGLAAVYVEKGTEGFDLGKRNYMMGLRGIPEMDVHFNDCAVPLDHVLMYGLKDIMGRYNNQRVGAATVALGLAQAGYEDALAYVKKREQFGHPIADFQGLQWRLVDSRLALDASRLLIHRAAASATTSGTGLPDPQLAALAKLHAAENAITVTSTALQLHGALGYSRNIRMERLFRDARMFTLGGGTTEALRNLIGASILKESR